MQNVNGPEEDWVRCKTCGNEVPENEALSVVAFHETILEPEERVTACPKCQSTDVEHYCVAWCQACEEEQVGDFDELCPACAGEAAEYYADMAEDR